MGESRSRAAKQIVVFVDLKRRSRVCPGDTHADTEPHRCGSGPGPHHRPGHSNVANDEVQSVSRDHSVDDDDDGRDLSTAFARLGFIENCTETFHPHACRLDY